jgi:tight adherence protein C
MIAALLFSLVCFLLVTALFRLGNERAGREAVSDRLRDMSDSRGGRPDVGGSSLAKGAAKVLVRLGDMLGTGKGSSKRADTLRLLLVRAGFRHPAALNVFLGARVLLTLAAFVLAAAVGVFALDFTFWDAIQMAVWPGLAAFLLIRVWLRRRVAARQEAIRRGLPDALDLLVVCVEAGLGMDAGIFRVGQELEHAHRELSDELKAMTLEMRAGKLRQHAFKDMAVRIGLEDMNSLVAVLIQTESFGTSIARALRVFAEDMRVKRFHRAEEIAARLPVKIAIPLILFIFPSIFVALLGPVVIQVIELLSV